MLQRLIGEEIRLSWEPGEFVLLSVTDDGQGMSEEVQKQIFEPFFTTKNVGEGTGLGLSTVYGIVQQNKGFIDIESQPGEGSTFHIYLSRYYSEQDNSVVRNADHQPAGHHELVLLVEDEPPMLNISKPMLEGLGYRVLTAGTPEEALTIARAQASEIRLLMTDVVMPECNGRELADRIAIRATSDFFKPILCAISSICRI